MSSLFGGGGGGTAPQTFFGQIPVLGLPPGLDPESTRRRRTVARNARGNQRGRSRLIVAGRKVALEARQARRDLKLGTD